MVLFLSNSALADAKTCASLFLAAPSKLELFQDLNTRVVNQADFALWQSSLNSLRTPSQYLEFLKYLQELSARRILPQDMNYGITGDTRGDVGLVFRLQGLDFVSPLILFREHLTAEQKEVFLRNFQKIQQNGLDQSIESRRRWLELEVIFKLALMPETLSQFILDASPKTDYSKAEFNFSFGPSARMALSLMPEPIKQAAAPVLAQEMQKEYALNGEREKKLRRRNLEVIHYYLAAKTLLVKARQLHQRPSSAKTLTEWFDQYWSPLMSAPLPPGAGHYSFGKVLEIAEVIRQEMKSHLEDTYIDLYGSLPNMKAKLSSSDVDIHLGDSMMRKYREALSSGIRNFADHEKIQNVGVTIPANLQNLLIDLQQTENTVAQFLGRSAHKGAELLTIVPIDPAGINRFYEPKKFQFYNAVKVRIYLDHIELQVYDYFTGRMLIVPLQM